MQHIPFIRFNHLGDDKIVMTNIFGENIVLGNTEFEKYIDNSLDSTSTLYKDLESKGFFRSPDYEDTAIQKYKGRFGVNFIGPTLHIIVLTKGCNHQCKYCHAAADYRYTDESLSLSEENARKVVDIILQSPSKELTIEFQGGEPLVNLEILDFIINYTMEQNKKTKKKIHFALVSNLTMIDDAIMDKLLSYPNFSISTSLDGDKQTHDFARLMIGKGKDISSFDTLSKKIHFIREKEKKAGKRLLGGAMGVITKKTLTRYKELVDTYVELGFDSIFLKKINALGFAENTKNTIGYSTEELQTFYKNYYGHLVELFEKGTIIRDGFLSITLGKILKPEKTNFMDLRSPCGAAIGQIAYDYTGKIYTCDEGRMVDDDVFKIGDTDNSLQELIQNDIVGAMMDASTVESLPCDICAYAPYCGVCPIESYQGRGNIYTNQVFDAHCSFFMFLFDWIFEILSNKDSLEYKFLMSQVI